MTPAGCVLKSFPRKDRREGSLVFLMKKSLEKHIVVKLIFFSTFEAFEARTYYVNQYFTHFGLFVPHSKLNKSKNKMILDQFPDFLHSFNDGKGEITVVGDFNFHFANEHDSEVCKLRSLLDDCCLKELIN